MATPRYPELYAKVKEEIKQRVSRWPSAYASGQLVRHYKNLVKHTYGPHIQPYLEDPTTSSNAPLSTWFRERWVDIATGKPCGSVKTRDYYPVCRPERIARQLTKTQRLEAIQIKQRAKTKTATYPAYFH